MNAKLMCTQAGVEALKMYVPKGCPFKDYTLYDLLADTWHMYSWMVTTKEINVVDFLEMMIDKDAHIHCYGEDMIKVYKEATEYDVQ